MRIGIRVRVLVSFLAVAITVSLFSGILMYVKYRNMMVSKTKNDIGITTEIRNELNDLMLLIEKGGNYISFNETIIESLHTKIDDGIERAANINAFSDEIKKTYELLLGNKFGGHLLSFYINPELEVTEYIADGARTIWGMKNMSFGLYTGNLSEKWYADVVNKNGAIHLFRSTQPTDTYIYISKLIKNQNKKDSSYKDILGVSVVGIESKQILSRFERLKMADNMQFAVIDNNKNVVCKTSDEFSDEFILETLNQNAPTAGTTGVLEKDNLLINTDKTDMGICLMSIMPLEDIYLVTREIRNVLILSISISVILAVIISLILSASFTKPIENLSGVMLAEKEEERKNLGLLAVKNDEVGDLYKAFSKLINDLDEKNKRTQELEMKMFQLQINPHFLYNTLDSIAWRAISNGQTDIVDMIEGLSEIFKYSVKNNEQFAMLKEEAEVVSKYVKLQKNRIARDICFEYEIPEELKTVMVPKCILQPLVENSILHAEECADSNLIIKIVAQKENDKILIKVCDNGTKGEIEKLNQYLSGNNEIFSNGEMGIRNVNVRIKLKFEKNSGLYYEKNENGGTTAVIVIDEDKQI